jgi:hypothetical protein
MTDDPIKRLADVIQRVVADLEPARGEAIAAAIRALKDQP